MYNHFIHRERRESKSKNVQSKLKTLDFKTTIKIFIFNFDIFR